MIKDFKIFENVDNTDVITSYIVGMPSGEVLDVTDDEFVKLKKQRLLKYNKDSKYFTFLDLNYKIIKKALQDPKMIQYIHYLMDKFGISNYKINADMTVDVDGDVDISQRGLTKIPVKFGRIKGNFDCSLNKLTNLVGAPNEVAGTFDCSCNQLYTLIGGPRFTAGGYYCSDNLLEDLEGFPEYCQVIFDCARNHLKTLKGVPEVIEVRFFDCSYNQLKNLFSAPKKTQNFDCSNNLITTLTNGPREVKGYFDCTYNRLFDIMGMPSCDKIKYIEGNEIDEVDYD